MPETYVNDGYLKEIACINIKKSIGLSKSNNKEIQNFAKNDKEFLVEQLGNLKPQVVVCGGTFWSYHLLYNDREPLVNIGERVWLHGKRVIIDYYHPGYFATPGGERGLYQRFVELLQQPAVEKALQGI